MYNYDKKWYEKGDITKLTSISPEKVLVFDTETTGLNPYGNDEILQLAIINGNGEELFNSYFKPEMRKTWTKAAEVNGITPRMVKNSPHFEDLQDEIQNIFDSAELIIAYNVEFDIRFLMASGIKLKKNLLIFDVMQEYAAARGQIDNRFGDYKWYKLEQCASSYKYKFDAHDALEDTKATLHCYNSLLQDNRYLDIVNEYKIALDRKREEKARAEEMRRAEEARAEEARRAEEEKRQRREEKKQEIYQKAEKPLNIVKIILMVVGILWIVVITLAGLSAKIGIGFTLLFDVPGVIALIIALKIKDKYKQNGQ